MSDVWKFLTESEVMNEPWTLWVPIVLASVVIAAVRIRRIFKGDRRK